MQRGGFTWIDMVLLVYLVVVVVLLSLPLLNRGYQVSPQFQNATRLRGIHQQMATFARSNKGYYPGLDPTGQVIPVASIAGGNQLQDGADPGSRVAILIEEDYFGPDYAISPLEDSKQDWDRKSDVTEANYSYAMLALDKPGRVGEWHDTLSSDAVVVSDRAIRNGTGIRSIHTSPATDATDWRGNIVYNDNRTTFETTSVISQSTTGNTTRYSASKQANPRDDLFADDGAGGFDALMVYEDSRDVIDD